MQEPNGPVGHLHSTLHARDINVDRDNNNLVDINVDRDNNNLVDINVDRDNNNLVNINVDHCIQRCPHFRGLE